MAIRSQRRTYHRKVRAGLKESEPDPEQASAMDLDQVLDRAQMEIWALATSRSVPAVMGDRRVRVVQTVAKARLDSAAVDLFRERVCYQNRNRSTPRTHARIRSRERLCCALSLRAQVKSCRYVRCVRCRLG